MYIVKRYYFSPVCTFKKAINKSEVKLIGQKGVLRFREKINNMCYFQLIHVSIHCCHMAIVLNDCLVHSCQGLYLGSRYYKLRLL